MPFPTVSVYFSNLKIPNFFFFGKRARNNDSYKVREFRQMVKTLKKNDLSKSLRRMPTKLKIVNFQLSHVRTKSVLKYLLIRNLVLKNSNNTKPNPTVCVTDLGKLNLTIVVRL